MRIAKAILEMLFWMLAAGAVLFGAGVIIGFVITPVLGYVAAVVMLAMMPVLVRVSRTFRRRRAMTAISYLEQAVRLNLPLPRMLYVAQRGESGTLSLRLAHFRQLLDDGYPIGAALEAGIPEISAREAALIESSERLGRLPQTLHKLVTEHAAEAARKQAGEVAFYRTYPFIMAVVLTSVLAMIMVFIIPKYQAIFADFGIRLPDVTVRTIQAARVLGTPVLAIVSAAVLVWTGLAMWQSFRPVRFTTLFGRGVYDRIVWATPIAHGIARDRGLADAFDLIAAAVSNATPIERAFGEAAQLEINFALRRRFDRWADGLGAGMSLAEAARAADMPQLVVSMLASVHGADAAAEVFGFLARYYHTRYSRAAAIAYGASVPLVVFFFAALVMCVALAMFLPLVHMIDHLVPAMEVF